MRAGRWRLTYGLERLAMYLQGVDRSAISIQRPRRRRKSHLCRRVPEAEQEYSGTISNIADTDMLFEQIGMAEEPAGNISKPAGKTASARRT